MKFKTYTKSFNIVIDIFLDLVYNKDVNERYTYRVAHRATKSVYGNAIKKSK